MEVSLQPRHLTVILGCTSSVPGEMQEIVQRLIKQSLPSNMLVFSKGGFHCKLINDSAG